MRQLATYCLEAKIAPTEMSGAMESLANTVNQWLSSKGRLDEACGELVMKSGKIATFMSDSVSAAEGRIESLSLEEPSPNGRFRTSITYGCLPDTLGVCVTLAASTNTAAPVGLDIYAPRVVRQIVELPLPWNLRGLPARSRPRYLSGDVGGDEFLSLIEDRARPIPVIAISSEYGAMLEDGIAETIALDLVALAHVVVLDVDASWRVTKRRGKEWSCYAGAIRLYWPLSEGSGPLSCPLWTPSRLLHGVAGTEEAADRIRGQLRRKVLAQSAFAFGEPSFFRDVRQSAERSRIDALLKAAADSGDYKSVAEEFLEKVISAERQRDEAQSLVRELRAKLQNAELALRYRDVGDDGLVPVDEAPPASVEEAVYAAIDRFEADLAFGPAVNDSIEGLAPDAGPPEKILQYFEGLAELSRAKRKGALGTTTVDWLEQRGFTCSGESETTRNNKTEVARRTWPVGSGLEPRYFDLHLKPSDATSPDRCVRIYFEFVDEFDKVIVAWVGRKPGL